MPPDLRPVLYRPRIVDVELRRRLAAAGAVLIEGPKACGKTATAEQVAASKVFLDIEPALRVMADVDPSLILDGDTPRLIDEWQTAPAIWNHVRRAVDARGGAAGQFILTGSAVPPDDVIRHTGAGRLSRLRMRPMSLYESGHSAGDVSLGAVVEGESVHAQDVGVNVSDLALRIAVGGWPALIAAEPAAALQRVRDYVDEIRRTDIERVDGRRRDPARVLRFLRSLARNTATEARTATLIADTGGPREEPLDERTAYSYLSALERLMIIEDQPAWAPHLRSKARLRDAPKRHFVDPSLAVAALGADPQRIVKDLNFFGFLFESMVVRDLRIYAQAHEAEVFHYRDNSGLEVDAIVQTASGAWAAFEVKLGGEDPIDKGAENLHRLANKVDITGSGEPTALGVIVATGYGYTRADGVSVIPVASLGP